MNNWDLHHYFLCIRTYRTWWFFVNHTIRTIRAIINRFRDQEPTNSCALNDIEHIAYFLHSVTLFSKNCWCTVDNSWKHSYLKPPKWIFLKMAFWFVWAPARYCHVHACPTIDRWRLYTATIWPEVVNNIHLSDSYTVRQERTHKNNLRRFWKKCQYEEIIFIQIRKFY